MIRRAGRRPGNAAGDARPSAARAGAGKQEGIRRFIPWLLVALCLLLLFALARLDTGVCPI